MSLQHKSVKGMSPESKDSKDTMSESSVNGNINAPKYGTVIPNRIFVGGISPSTTETDLSQLFSSYGNVRNSKIIFDRGGVSKGYGFVTFETEDEAKRLRDADNIVLRDRKLNIAPAIMKQQAFTRNGYEGGHPPASPHPSTPAYHQNGSVPYTYLNGTAFFSPSPTQNGCVSSVSSNSVEPVYNPAPYSLMQSPPSGGYPTYPYMYQGQIYYPPAAYQQYPISHFDGCYQVGEPQGGQMMVQPNCENNVVLPPVHYYCPVPPYHQQDISFMPPIMHQIAVHQDPNAHQPLVYSSQRHYEQPAAVVISEPSSSANSPGKVSESSVQEKRSLVEEKKPPLIKKYETPPTVSSSFLKGDSKKEVLQTLGQELPLSSSTHPHPPPQTHPPFSHNREKVYSSSNRGRKSTISNPPSKFLNNNSPDVKNRNLGKKCPFPPFSGHHPMKPYPAHSPPNLKPSFQVPHFPLYPNRNNFSSLGPTSSGNPPMYPGNQRRFTKTKNGGGRNGGGRGGKCGGGGDSSVECPSESGVVVSTLTPPITPRSNQEDEQSPPSPANHELTQSFQSLEL